MEIKNSKRMDAVGNLYRSALYLGRGVKKTGVIFFNRAKMELGSEILVDFSDIGPDEDLKYWAEKILDEYKRLKTKLM